MQQSKERKSPEPEDLKSVTNKEKEHDDELLDEALEESFPASDPPALTEP
jgi:hypothetical protein